MPRTPGRIDGGGEPVLAGRLVAALAAANTDREIAESVTHPFHTYPARMHPATARALVELFCDRAPAGAVVVDPFAGSGTTLVEARAVGVDAVGVDLNPLAVLIARAKTWTQTNARISALRNTGGRIAGAVLAAGRAARRADAEPMPLRRIEGFDPNARNRRLARWFLPHVRRELELIAAHLDELRATDAELADVLTAALSAILYKVSSRTSDTDPTWVDRQVARGAAARLFAERTELLAAGLLDLGRTRGRPARVIEADARALGAHVAAGTAWAVITSPPYAGTYDYAEHQRLRFDFLGLRHRAFDEGELGPRRVLSAGPGAGAAVGAPAAAPRTRNPLPRHVQERQRRAAAAAAPVAPAVDPWRDELATILDQLARALRPGRYAALVIGDSVAAGRAHHALDDLRDALPGSLDLIGWASQQRPMLGTVERRAFGARPKAEHVVVLRAAQS
jgi:ketosteroid isomerase-like protein